MTGGLVRALTGACLTFAMTVAACGGDDRPAVEETASAEGNGEATTTSTTAEPDKQDPSELARDYFDILGRDDLGEMAGMLDLATPGSPAHLYAQHQIAFTRALGSLPGTTEVRSDAIEMCSELLDENGQTRQECYIYADFEANADTGLLESFSVDGNPIDGRIAAGDPEGVTEQGVTVKVVTAFQATRGNMAINADVVNNLSTPVDVAEYDFEYVDADGRQYAQAPFVFSNLPSTIQPGATASAVGLFEQAPFGGTFTFVGFTNDFATEIRISVPVSG